MKLIMIPNDINEQEFIRVSNIIAEFSEDHETENDYCLVDRLGDMINVKVFVGSEVDRLCKMMECTPREYLMEQILEQNGVTYNG